MSRFGKPDHRTDHRYFEDRLSAYLDGELVPQEHDAVARHLATCQACQWDLGTLQQTVQWMKELEPVPVPRVFTVPVPAPRERAAPRWRLVPVLQAATAFVALLLFFAVAGDFFLAGFRSGYAPEPMLMQDQAPAAVEVTRVVELEMEVAEPAAEMVVVETVEVEKVVVETVVVQVEKEVVVPAPTPMPEAPVAAEAAPPEEPEAEKAAEEGQADAAGVAPTVLAARTATAASTALEAMTATAAPQTGEAARALASQPAETPALTSTVGGGATPTIVASPSPTPIEVSPEPTVVAEARQVVPVDESEWDEAPAGAWLEPGVNWLRVAEGLLAVALLVLVTVTIVSMIQRRRAR